MQTKPKKPAPSSAWKKGQSGNPGGRKPIPRDVLEMARAACPEAVQRLVTAMREDCGKVAVTAAVALLNRAYGAPTQPLTGADGAPLIPPRPDLSRLTSEELAVYVALAEKTARGAAR
jgi:hypothetical protein